MFQFRLVFLYFYTKKAMKKTVTLLLSLTVYCLLYSHPVVKSSSALSGVPFSDPPNLYNDYFAGAGACMLCHNAQVNSLGMPVAIVNDWRSTMMANSSKDPFWQAKVSHEILVNPQLSDEIQTVCTRCHAPMGNVNALYGGASHYTLEDMRNDELAMDGASCTVCHQITPESMGNYSGTFSIGNGKITYGPYPTPFSNPMINNTGFIPTYSEHIKDSRVCATCHTLITNPLDLNGVPTGGEFVEQAPYQEWKNSVYPTQNKACFTCHVPEIEDLVVISTIPAWLTGRTPYGKHHLVGANSFMLKLLRSNIDELGLTASSQHFDTTIARTYQNLQLSTLDLTLSEINRTEDTLFLDLTLVNKAGHKLPTSYPGRRVYIEMVAVDATGDTVFHSGKMDEEFNIIGEDTDFEPHHDLIVHNDQVQIYEMVMGDVNGDVTTVLERAAIHLKDNRIPPEGFTMNHPSYDTVKIAGSALSDPDFNYLSGTQGSGSDIIHFHLPTHQNTSAINIYATAYYQTVSNKWLEEMFSFESAEINTFKALYHAADKSPVMLASRSLTSVYTAMDENPSLLSVFPNPTHREIMLESQADVYSVEVFQLNGKLINRYDLKNNPTKTVKISVADNSGLYFLVVDTEESRQIKKVVVF